MLEDLKDSVCRANLDLVRHGLVILTWGNVSGIDREKGLVVIKPSGVSYDEMKPADMVVVDLEGKTVEGAFRPSSDTPTHLELYRAWPAVGGIAHTHSTYATMFAQASTPVRCMGTTHADHFHGDVPVTRSLTQQEVSEGYEINTGRVIVERFKDVDPVGMPAVLVDHHGPFTWGEDAGKAVVNSVALEASAKMAMGAALINPSAEALPSHILEKHYTRKHGPSAYYGQK